MNQLAFAKLVNFVSTDIVHAGEVINIINDDERVTSPAGELDAGIGELEPAHGNLLNSTMQAVSSDSANDEIQFYIPSEIPLEILTNSHTAHNFYNWLSTLINIKLEHDVSNID